MPSYDYRCADCREEFSVERSMSDDTKQHCIQCGTHNINRIWNITFRTGGVTPDYGQGTGSTKGGGSVEGSKSGCGSCVSKSCGTCH
jgi:putative FmdB family regulatory protein